MAFSFGKPPASSNTTGFGTPAGTGFGAPTTNTGFGTPSNATNTGFGATSTAGGFGTTPSTGFGATSTAGGFGATSTAGGFGTNPSTGFGATSTAGGFGATSTAGGFGSTLSTGFGATSTAGGLGQSTTTGFGQPAKTGFGASFGNNTAQPSLFGSQGTTSFGQSNEEQQKKQREQQVYQLLMQINKDSESSRGRKGTEAKNIWQALALVKSYYDPKSPDCRFRHYFYNVVPANQVHLYTMPADHDQKEWENAQANNPDPEKMVPALAIGYEDVQKRIDQQNKLSDAHNGKLKELETVMNKIKDIHLSKTNMRINESKQRFMDIAQRLLWFMKYGQVIRRKGLSITAEEEAMLARLENVEDQLQRSEISHGKLNRLWAQLQLVKESRRKYGTIDHVEWNNVSDEQMREMTKNLNEQNNAIERVVQMVKTDTENANIVSRGYMTI
ncbi:hypothetical protein CU098_000567 [Rhizopus stolonifer]|uniref:Nucleoporin Nup54 alpha-helical domain-containing protein n=1 Tax=Rhizopus stolonifer TaxID=4846 RepID=A0A367IYW9_RHIST|nr:hypothetical protein CU098_000567 [Rhizopus stolonifer]